LVIESFVAFGVGVRPADRSLPGLEGLTSHGLIREVEDGDGARGLAAHPVDDLPGVVERGEVLKHTEGDRDVRAG
jgi:hypothetical protein